jgi:hypothetical protein
MPQVVITLTDTPAGGVSVHTDFKPAIGARCTLAQSAALDIVSRTRKHYGLQDPLPVAPGVDIDAVHLSPLCKEWVKAAT